MSKVRILYVEDEPSLSRIVSETLEGSGFEVNHTEDGINSIDICIRFNPDICILDVMLPGMDGYSLAKKLRMLMPDVPIIFLTAKIQTSDVTKGFESGGNDYIKKPFSMEELIARINNLLELTNNRRKTAKREILIGSYRFLPNRFELWKDGDLRKLSARESALLEMLYQSRNSTLYRKDILLKLWGDDSIFNSRNLDVYITHLRKYLAKDNSIQIITVKGIGYLFVCE
ncbi:MAG TPA: response regulator transcription factor [Bacteroidales bacterium]|nr:response regulator transcription factor [Bacteroidales bacterium]